MTIAWDPSIDRIVIELFSNVDVEEESRDGEHRHRSHPRSPTRSRPTRSSWSSSPPRMRGTSWPAPKPWWPLADHHVRSACSRWIRMGTFARGLTATVGRCSTDSCFDSR